MPMDENLNLESRLPQLGQTVSVVFGSSMDFSDLIEYHETVYGSLWKYDMRCSPNEWTSRPSDFILYHKITKRLESALNSLH